MAIQLGSGIPDGASVSNNTWASISQPSIVTIIKSINKFIGIPSEKTLKVSKLISLRDTYIGVPTEKTLTVTKLQAITKLIGIPTEKTLTVAKTQSTTKLIGILTEKTLKVSPVNNTISQTITVTTAPTTPREMLYYFNLAPGYKSNSSKTYGTSFVGIPIEKTLKISKLSPAGDKFIGTVSELTVSKLQSSTKLIGIPVEKTLKVSKLTPSGDKFIGIPIEKTLTVAKLQTTTKLIGIPTEKTLKVSKLTPSGDKFIGIPVEKTLKVSPVNNTVSQTIAVTTAPKTSREMLYYFNLAPGYKSNSSTTYGTSFVGIPIEKTLTVTKLQTTTKLIGIPTETTLKVSKLLSPRDTFIGVKSERTLTVAKTQSTTKLIGILTEKTLKVSPVNDTISQTIAVTTTPTTPREMLYYFNLAPGYKSKNPVLMGGLSDSSLLKINPVNNTISQTTAVTTTPTTPREMLYYFNLAPGYKSNSTVVQGKYVAHAGDVTTTIGSTNKLRTIIRDITNTPLILANTINDSIAQTTAVTTSPTTSRELLYYFNLAPGYKSNGTIVQGSFVTEAMPNYTLTSAKLTPASDIFVESTIVISANAINDIVDQTTAVITAPTTPREMLYYFNLAPGYKSNSTIVQGDLFASVDTTTSVKIQETQSGPLQFWN